MDTDIRNNIIVSVIMGVYSACSNLIVLQSSIESIQKQTFTNFEFIICDDGSTDNTYKEIKKLVQYDKKVILIKNEVNMGLAYTLNRCLEVAKGKYIARMDADDISAPNRLEEQVSFLNRNSQYVLVGCNAELINGSSIWGKRMKEEKPTNKSFLFNSPFIHPTIMMRKEVYQELNGYRVSKDTMRAEDYDLFMRLYAKGYKGYNIQKFLFQFREDNKAYQRRKYKYRIGEAMVRYKGYKMLKLMPKGYIFILKPLIVGLVPQKLLALLRRERKTNMGIGETK